MKNLFLSAAVLLTFAFSTAAATAEPVNEKVLKTFTQIFKDAQQVSWSNRGDYFEAYFVSENVKTRALLNQKGALVQTIRYYKEAELPSNILYSIKEAYQGKSIFGVTEVTNHNGVHYRVVLRDDKHYTHINANSKGDTEIVKKYKRGDR